MVSKKYRLSYLQLFYNNLEEKDFQVQVDMARFLFCILSSDITLKEVREYCFAVKASILYRIIAEIISCRREERTMGFKDEVKELSKVVLSFQDCEEREYITDDEAIAAINVLNFSQYNKVPVRAVKSA